MSIYSDYQKQIESALLECEEILGPKSAIRDGCMYALSSGGKRVRPVIALMVADALGQGGDVTLAALGVEFFHTASLVADDLPSMDDDAMRRGKPSTHTLLGESGALLVSYALIAAGYDVIARNAEIAKGYLSNASDVGLLALKTAAFNTGLYGATGGQYLDIASSQRDVAAVEEVMHKKTASLFEIAFVYGWLFGGGDIAKLSSVKRLAAYFGAAFQLADDLGDLARDKQVEGTMNGAVLFGKEWAEKALEKAILGYLKELKLLNIDTPSLTSLVDVL